MKVDGRHSSLRETLESTCDAVASLAASGESTQETWQTLVAISENLCVHLRSALATSESGSRHKAEDVPGRRFGMIGQSDSIREIIRLIERVGPTDASVLITGENGTGKEGAARALHTVSKRAVANGAFCVVNCGALNDSLLESELFGHVKGAFTGAISDKKGLFEGAHKGTLFLDEIGETTPMLQVKLLRVLQEGTFIPVGGVLEKKVDVRIVSATNRDLKKMVKDARFREDLFYRLNVFHLHLPPLRERGDDLEVLAGHFLAAKSADYGMGRKFFSEDCLRHLKAHSWPGNVRELANMTERLVILAGEQACITEATLPADLRSGPLGGGPALQSAPQANFERGLLDQVDDFRRARIREALAHTQGNLTRAARLLQFTPQGLRRLMSVLGVANDAKDLRLP